MHSTRIYSKIHECSFDVYLFAYLEHLCNILFLMLLFQFNFTLWNAFKLVQVSDGLAFSKENIICTSISCYRMEMQENLKMEIEYQTEQSSNFKRIIWTEKLWFSYNWVSYWFESLSDLVIWLKWLKTEISMKIMNT